jgi:hypothetical protein
MHVRLDFLTGSVDEQEKVQTMVKTGQQAESPTNLSSELCVVQCVRTVVGDQQIFQLAGSCLAGHNLLRAMSWVGGTLFSEPHTA